LRGGASLILLALTSILAAQDFTQSPIEEIATGFTGGEGPVWSREGYLLFSDYDKDRIYKYVPGKSPEVYREGSNGANGNTMDRKGRLYTCEYRSRRVTRTGRDGKIEVIADRFEGKRFNAPNDIVVRRDGHIYFSDPLYTPLDHRDLDFFGLYHLTPKGRLEAISRTQTRPNGVTLSPDGKILYVADTDQKKILAYDLDRRGRASHPRIAIDSGADGIRTDQKGNLYLASRGVAVYSPQGKLLGKIQPKQNPRNIAFGDSDLRTLYMIGPTLYRVRLDIPGALQY
jgi:gluconolactonase